MLSRVRSFFVISVLGARYTLGSVVSGGVEYIGAPSPDVPTQEQFLGIPFASAGRFERPKAPKVTSPFNATNWGPFCPQLEDTPGFPQSEDCLSVNVWRPVGTTAASKLPVMVWIYGGSYTNGEAWAYPMDGFGWVAADRGKPVIGVNLNYRVGVYGFPIGEKAEANGALNLGLYDQRAALEWVQEHIADFGGDKTKVTLFGQSAGSVSVGLQMLYNGGNLGGAFQRAIMQSGSPNTFAADSASTPAREVAYSYLVDRTGCSTSKDTFACLKSASYETFNTAHISAYDYMRNYTVLDYGWSVFEPAVSAGDSFIPERPYTAILAGRFAKIPFISGTAVDEGTIFVPVPQTKQDTIDFLTVPSPGSDFGFANDIPAITNLVNNVYSDDPAEGSPYGTGQELFNTSRYWKQATSVTGDILFEAPRRFFLREAVKRGLDVWSYRWMQHNGIYDIFEPKYGISHAQEIYCEFGNPACSAEAFSVAAAYTDYFTSFAYTGSAATTPDTTLPVWKKYSENATSLTFHYQDYKMIKDDYRQSNIDTIIKTVLPFN